MSEAASTSVMRAQGNLDTESIVQVEGYKCANVVDVAYNFSPRNHLILPTCPRLRFDVLDLRRFR
jgi:hypothetical protein